MNFDADGFVDRVDRSCDPEFCQWLRERLAVPVHEDIGRAYIALCVAVDELEKDGADGRRFEVLDIIERVAQRSVEEEERVLQELFG